MSALFTLRQDLADSIISADIGWEEDTVLLKRQTDLWNDVATAMAGAAHGAILHIGVADGKSTEPDGLEMEITLPVTILCTPALTAGATPEEDLWEDLVRHIHDLRLGGNHFAYRFRFQSFADSEIEADGGTGYLARQTIFTVKISL